MGARSETKSKPAVVADQQKQCYELQLEGLSIRQIAERTGMSVATVHRRISAQCETVVPALEPTVPSVAEQVRARHLEQIKAWLVKLNEQIDRDCAVARNVEVGTRLLEREAKLLGIDAPQQVEATVTQVTQADLELQELLREARAASALEQEKLRTPDS